MRPSTSSPGATDEAGSLVLHAAGHTLRGKGPELAWTDDAGVTLDCRDEQWAMRQPQVQEPAASLSGTSWTLVHFQSSDDAVGTVVPSNVERYTLQFGADGALVLRLDCNRATGRWEAKPTSATGGSLTITGGRMTRAMCGPGAIDTPIARDLSRIRSYTIAGGRLSLALEADAGVYIWAATGGVQAGLRCDAAARRLRRRRALEFDGARQIVVRQGLQSLIRLRVARLAGHAQEILRLEPQRMGRVGFRADTNLSHQPVHVF